MITTINIYNSISKRLKTAIPNVETQIKDIKNITAPCFYIQFVSSNDREVASDTTNTICVFNVVYFSQAKTLLDLLQIKQHLLTAFKKPLAVSYSDLGNSVQIKYLSPEKLEVSINENEYFLTLSMDFDFIQNTEVENPYDEYQNDELMNVLNLERKN